MLEADRDRILAEARAAAAITHPNVATVHEVVEHDDRAFMVMEFVDGQSLDTLLARGGLTKIGLSTSAFELVGRLEQPMRATSFTGTSSPPTSC